MKYWKRITDAGCLDSASAYDRKRALDPRQRWQRREKKEEERKKAKFASFVHLPCYDVSPRHNFLLVFPRKIVIQIISRQRTKSHYEATRHHGDIVTKIIVGILRLGNTGKRERERQKEEREKKREKVQIQENDTHYRRNEFAARFESGSSMFAFNICLTFFSSACVYADAMWHTKREALLARAFR